MPVLPDECPFRVLPSSSCLCKGASYLRRTTWPSLQDLSRDCTCAASKSLHLLGERSVHAVGAWLSGLRHFGGPLHLAASTLLIAIIPPGFLTRKYILYTYRYTLISTYQRHIFHLLCRSVHLCTQKVHVLCRE